MIIILANARTVRVMDTVQLPKVTGMLLVLLVALVLTSGCPRVYECGPPCGLIVNNDTDQNMTSVSVSLQSGKWLDYGRIPAGKSAFRLVQLRRQACVTLNIEYATGRIERRVLIVKVAKLSPVELHVCNGYTHHYIVEPPPRDARGPSVFWIANDTPNSVDAIVQFALGTGGYSGKLPPYSVVTGGGPRRVNEKLLGEERATIQLTYADGAVYDILVTLELSPKEPLFFIIREDGEVTVWSDCGDNTEP